MASARLFTIGFTGKTASSFFELVQSSGASKLIDIRINRTSQLSGFAKEADLKYFLEKLTKATYSVEENLAPSRTLLADYRKGLISWSEYEHSFLQLLERRNALAAINLRNYENAILLCSEALPERCHRRLVAEQIQKIDPNVQVIHL